MLRSASELFAIALLGCGSPPPPPAAAPVPPAPSVKLPTFRWVASGNGCTDAPDTCLLAVPGRDEGPFVVAVYPPPADDPRVVLVAYEGDHAGGRRKWQAQVDVGATAMPAMALGGDRAVVAAASGVVVRLAVVDTTDGVLEGQRAIEWPAVGVQLRDDESFIDVFALDRDGTGHVGIFDPRRLETIATGAIPANAIQLAASPRAIAGTTTAQLGGATFEIVADGEREMLRRRGGWSSRVADYPSVLAGLTLHAASARSGLPDGGAESIDLLIVVAEPHDEGTTVSAFDARTGHLQWDHEFARLHGGSIPRRVHSYVDGGLLVVQLADNETVTSSESMTSCALALSDGHEVACVSGIPL